MVRRVVVVVVIVVVAAVAAALGFAAAFVANLQVKDPAVQGAVVGAIAGVVGGILGASIAAVVAWAVARMNRDEGRRTRVMDRLVTVAAEFAQAGDRHCQEVAQQFTWRVEQAAAGGTPTNVPPVGSTQALRDAVNVLFVVAGPDTAELALAYYQWVIELDRFAFDPVRHLGFGKVILLPGDHGSAMGMAQLQATAAKTGFMNAVRAELGRPALLDDLNTTQHH